MSTWLSELSEITTATDGLRFLLGSGLRVTVLLLFAAVASLAVWRRGSAGLQHTVWCLALVGTLLVPMLSIALPNWHVLPLGTNMPYGGTIPESTPIAFELTTGPLDSAARVNGNSFLIDGTGIDHADGAYHPQAQSVDLAKWAVFVWAFGTLLAISPWFLGVVSLWRLQGSSVRISDPSWLRLLDTLAVELRVRRNVTLLRTPIRSMPMTWGIFRPLVLLPQGSEEWSDEQRAAVLLHELAHVKRWDCVIAMVSRVACALYWFHPVVWFAAHRTASERERACDDLVLNTGLSGADYANHLLQIAPGFRRYRFAGTYSASMARSSELEGRLRAILDYTRNRRGLTGWGTAGVAAVFVMCVTAVAVVQPVLHADSSPKEKQDSQVDTLLSMHASGLIVLDLHDGFLRIKSTVGADSCEFDNRMFVMTRNGSKARARRVRLTHDPLSDESARVARRREFQSLNDDVGRIRTRLAQTEGKSADEVRKLREQVDEKQRFLDRMEDAIYVEATNGALLFQREGRRKYASARVIGGVIRVESNGHIVEAESVGLDVGLRPVRRDETTSAVLGWRREFDELYSLHPREVLRWVPAPFIEARQIYVTHEIPGYHRSKPTPPPGFLCFRWDGEVQGWSVIGMQAITLGGVLNHAVGLKRYQFDGPSDLLFLKLGGDWVGRDGIRAEEKLQALEAILRVKLGRAITAQRSRTTCDTIVVRGTYQRIPLPDVEEPDKLWIFAGSIDEMTGGGSGGTTSVAGVIEQVGEMFNKPVVFHSKGLENQRIAYRCDLTVSISHPPRGMTEAQRERSVLDHLSRQTSLELTMEPRAVDVWNLTEDASP